MNKKNRIQHPWQTSDSRALICICNDAVRMDEMAKQKKEFPYSTEPLKEYSIPTLNMVVSMEQPEALEFLKQHETKVLHEIRNLNLYGEFYEQRLSELKTWISEAYNVENVEQAISEVLQRKYSDERKSSEDVSQPGAPNTAVKPPAIRLKLQSTSPSTTATSPITADAPNPGRRGSKNLSRMNRPQDSAKSVDLKPKIPNQSPITVFWNYVEPFFKNIEEGDAKFLEDPAKVFDPTPFTIPPLGRNYAEQWREAYGYQSQASHALKRSTVTPAIRMHTLRERLLSMLLEEKDFDPNSMGLFQQHEEDNNTCNSSIFPDDSVIDLNERIRKDMAEAGLIDNAFIKEFAEDDEICRQITALQQELKRQTVVNTYRKKALYERIKKYLAAQEFWSLINELDKQIEQTYSRLAKQPSVKKRRTMSSQKGGKTASSSGTTSPPPLPSNEGEEAALKLLDHHDKLMQSISHTLPSRAETFLPMEAKESLFDPMIESKLIEEAERSGGWMRFAIDSFLELEAKGTLGLSDPISFVVN